MRESGGFAGSARTREPSTRFERDVSSCHFGNVLHEIGRIQPINAKLVEGHDALASRVYVEKVVPNGAKLYDVIC